MRGLTNGIGATRFFPRTVVCREPSTPIWHASSHETWSVSCLVLRVTLTRFFVRSLSFGAVLSGLAGLAPGPLLGGASGLHHALLAAGSR